MEELSIRIPGRQETAARYGLDHDGRHVCAPPR
jgi:hypothetical protein